MCGVVSEALASGKLVHREMSGEGSQTAKSGTDEQKIRFVNKRRRDMRHSYSGKQSTRSPYVFLIIMKSAFSN
jgi:hypothetical protein